MAGSWKSYDAATLTNFSNNGFGAMLNLGLMKQSLYKTLQKTLS